MRVVIPTGLITSVVAALNLVLYLTTETSVPLVFNIPLAKLYTNCVLSTLNARQFWFSHSSADMPSSRFKPKLHFRVPRPQRGACIHVTTTSIVRPLCTRYKLTNHKYRVPCNVHRDIGGKTFEMEPVESSGVVTVGSVEEHDTDDTGYNMKIPELTTNTEVTELAV
ncbi:hypothetical protein NEOLEDRAFT_171582 [Neolentinus lepideus HHB14362 ss-1]|uniref:DUF6534 domain-containing protein n=1 Tax=Neolentinus lepideus HHB14362 ss-1 TaxID=1314782 RepID=A0A165MIL0_9AGAM|nr:hypothetical protein NEOLEDRAFT_171582 [Neolentinus lepideus HHB14362 ss-1]